MRELPKNYDPKRFEDRIYREWEEGGYFHPVIDREKKPFTIVMPPPNITGQLHMGHALDQTLQDVLTRWRRMQGYCALWLPGTDHASIATEVKVVEEVFRTEGKTKEELGREEFLKRAWDWKALYGGKITEQQRRLGASCDWKRERFTMDEGCNKAVVAFFVRLYEKGFIYKGKRMINWCPDCGTSLSDAEVEHEDEKGKYWYFRYPGADGGEGIVVATSRPETMFGDTAVAVHPEDGRYSHLIGTKVVLPVVGREIPVVADSYPDPEKGSGAVKITPAHDMNDFEVGQRHGLPQIVCIGEDAKMKVEAGEYAGMDRYECRRRWVEALAEEGYLVKTEEVVIPTGKCYRCDAAVEPMLSEQWFVRMEELAAPALEAARKGDLSHVPERFEKIYIHWLEGIRDWCISRQLWWGHRIPAWTCEECGRLIVSAETPNACPDCGGDLRQDEDVLDTWFSSGLWPFSTLGWPDKTEDLDYFYPTSVLVTSYDIIFFWVVRMVFSAMEIMGEIPFRHVFIHGLVRDAQGRKMSKSLNNGIDPLVAIDQYGADALRFMLLNGSSPGNDMRFSGERMEAARNFANKLWNASRFVLMNLEEEAERKTHTDDGDPSNKNGDPSTQIGDSLNRNGDPSTQIGDSLNRNGDPSTQIGDPLNKNGDPSTKIGDPSNKSGDPLSLCGLPEERLKPEDRWILSRINDAANDITRNMEKYELSLAVQKINELIWNEYCDWYIELVKARLYGSDQEEKLVVRQVLVTALSDLLRLLHPFMPFITEEIWGSLGKANKLIADSWPVFDENMASRWKEDADGIELIMAVIRSIRTIRTEADAAPSRKLSVVAVTDDVEKADALRKLAGHVEALAGVTRVSVVEKASAGPDAAAAGAQPESGVPEEAASAIAGGVELYVPLDELLDYEAEKEKLARERVRLEGEIKRLDGKLANEGFTSRAPAHVVDGERLKLAAAEEDYRKVIAREEVVKEKTK